MYKADNCGVGSDERDFLNKKRRNIHNSFSQLVS